MCLISNKHFQGWYNEQIHQRHIVSKYILTETGLYVDLE